MSNMVWTGGITRHHAVPAETTERMERGLPFKRLAASIVARQMSDAATTTTATYQDALTDRDAEAALRYLTDRYGQNARSRNFWLAALGIDGDSFASRLVALLESDKPFTADGYGYWTPKNAFAARTRWRAMKGLPPPEE